jgi:hypothetical protein
MPIKEQRRSVIQAGKNAWFGLHVSHSVPLLAVRGYVHEIQSPKMANFSPLSCRLFENAASPVLTLPERFPKLTFAMIAVALFAFTAAIEYEYLHSAGYYWR